MPNFTTTASYNGIAQDSHFGDKWECAFMTDISIDEMRYERLKNTFALVHDMDSTDTFLQIVETPNGLISVGETKIFLNATDKSATLAGANRMEFIGDSSGVQYNYFFNSSNVYKTPWDISSITTTVAHTAWTVTSSCVVTTDILFAVAGVIYKYDTLTNTIATACDTLVTGSTVKYMYFYNDMVSVVTTKGSDTIIYQLQYEGAGIYTIYSKEDKLGFLCVGAIGDSGITYWITTTKIFGFSWGTSQEIRYIGKNSSFDEATFTATPKLAFYAGYLVIGAGTTLWRWWAKNSSRRKSLTTQTLTGTISATTGKYSILETTIATVTRKRIYTDSSKYPNSGYSITLPYDAWMFGDEKTNLAFQVGYQLKTGTSIDIGIMTDVMETVNTTTYATLSSITDTAKKKQTFTVDEINQALEAAWYSSDWNSIRFKRTLNGWAGSSWLRDNTPTLYEMKCIHKFSNNDL